jgi:hypothetical protein
MREFLEHEEMQTAIMAILRAALSFVPQIPLQAHMNRIQAEAGGMRRMVAQSMRFHRHNARLQHDACRILSYLPIPSVALSDALRVYILKSLVAAMQEFPVDYTLQRKCLISIEHISDPMQTQPFFMADTHNMFLVVFECIQMRPFAQNIVSVAVVLLARFAAYISNLVFSHDVRIEEAFAGCDIAAMQDLLLRCIEAFEMDHNIVICNLMTLSYLIGAFPAHMRLEDRKDRCLSIAVRAVMTHGEHEEALEFGIGVITAVFPSFWCPKTGVADTAGAKTLMPIQTIVPLLVSGLRVAQFSATSKPICTQLFHLLCLFCQNHPSNAQFVQDCRVLNILTETYQGATVPHVDHEFLRLRGLLQTLLASFMRDTTVAVPL